jgi:putative phosphoesterase
MTRIGLISDTHGYLDPTLKKHFEECTEIWHAGDFGSVEVIDQLTSWGKPLRLVFGNIDDHVVRSMAPKELFFRCEGHTVFMTHIAGYPDRYNQHAREVIQRSAPGIVVCGHSHILKVIYDKKLQHLHINPGSCGKYGIHQVRTAIRFTVDGTNIKDMQVIELGKRGNS